MPETDKKDGKLDWDGMLWDMGVVVKDVVLVDEFHETVKYKWRDT